jgi:hypothetical protein
VEETEAATSPLTAREASPDLHGQVGTVLWQGRGKAATAANGEVQRRCREVRWRWRKARQRQREERGGRDGGRSSGSGDGGRKADSGEGRKERRRLR